MRDLKSATADKSVIDAEVQVLKNLKNDYKTLTGEEWKPPAKVENSKPQDNKVDTEQQVSKVKFLEHFMDLDLFLTNLNHDSFFEIKFLLDRPVLIRF